MNTPLVNYCIPEDLEQYLSFYGLHFNRKLFQFAVSLMTREDKATGELRKITPMTMDELKALMAKHKIELEPSELYDALYLANMAKADYWGSSIEDDEHLVKYVRDVICDVDGYTGIAFCRFLADCNAKGISILWDMVL